ncbi:MAG: 2OG-Fe(II) oxygenase [Planctomycetota bacterium]
MSESEKKPFILVENVLLDSELDFIWKFLKASQKIFVSTAFEGHPEIRKSHVLTIESLPIFELLAPKLIPLMFEAASSFNIKTPLNWVNIEYQCTRSGNGEFYRAHRDRASEEIKEVPTIQFKRPKKQKKKLKKNITIKDPHLRALTYVYYFHKPGVFTGGELWMEPDYTLQMPHNSLILFNPRVLHAVRVVNSDDNAEWLDARWTLNGWVSEYQMEPEDFLTQKLNEIREEGEATEKELETEKEKSSGATLTLKPPLETSGWVAPIQRKSRRCLTDFLEH